MNQVINENTKCLMIVHSYHHNNTLKIAQVFSEILKAEIKTVDQVDVNELGQYDLIGFGAGIDSGHHYQPLLDLAETLPLVKESKSFIFSTSGVMGEKKVWKDHKALRDILSGKGYAILDEFACKGFNTNSVLKYFGGMNKGRPNLDDLDKAKRFATALVQNTSKDN